jgi:iron(III) transport system ATP-binding protein
MSSDLRDTGRTDTDAPNDDDASGAGEAVLELDGVSKRFGSETVIEEMSLSVRDGEIVTLLGPSGCGKTTTLRLIAGLERPDAGEIRLRGESVAGEGAFVVPERRDVGVVFQEFALFPHLTARENIAFGLEDRSEAEREARVDEMLTLVGLEAQDDSYPSELSGGQQQRVALARSLAPEPEMLLLDEPFSNLDVDLRVRMREEVREILKAAGVTAVSVTHDQEEALSISDRVAVVNEGRIEQIGRPEAVFQHPESRFVAGFLGHASFLPGRVNDDGVETAVGTIPRDHIHGLTSEYDEADVDVLVRPDDVSATPVADAGEADGRVASRRYLGPTVLYEVDLDDGDRVQCMHNHDDRVELDTAVAVAVESDHELSWFPPERATDGTAGDAAGRSEGSDATDATDSTDATDPAGSPADD